MTRAYNFGAGPSMLPEVILREVQDELLDWQHLGMSVLEIGHRTPEFTKLMVETEQDLREILAIPEHYHVLFLSGVARMQFAMIPMNFLAEGEEAGYLISGFWSKMAFDEASKSKKAYQVTNIETTDFTAIPPKTDWLEKKGTKYFYYTPNETIQGIRFPNPPKWLNAPLVADMTSCLLSEPINIEDYDLIFAGAQKNIANAGLTIAILSDNFLSTISDNTLPTILDYRTHSSTKSTYATLPTFNCYLANKMFQWVKRQGGVDALYKINCRKAALLYDYIDQSTLYHCKIAKDDRSLVNVCFTLNNLSLEPDFLDAAKNQGLLALKGHRMVGGLRASLYNAMPIEGVECLISFMEDFARKHGE